MKPFTMVVDDALLIPGRRIQCLGGHGKLYDAVITKIANPASYIQVRYQAEDGERTADIWIEQIKFYEPMRALCLWQPWASLMAVALKTIETRGRPCGVRGDVAICSTMNQYHAKDIISAELASQIWRMKELFSGYHGNVAELIEQLPRGKVLCMVNLCGCLPTEQVTSHVSDFGPTERAAGDYRPGRFAWLTKDLRPLKEPVPCKGKQGFFFLDRETELKVRKQL